MKNLRMLGALAVAWLALVGSAYGQAQIDRTNFSTAVTATGDQVTLAAASGAVAGDALFVDGELMRLLTNTTGTTWRVRRGADTGGQTGPHSVNAIVWVGGGEEFTTSNVVGTCVMGQLRYHPHINTKENRIFDCAGNGVWMERGKLQSVSVSQASTVCGGLLRCREEFNGGHLVMQDDGTAKSVTDAEENFVYGSPLGAIEYREELGKTVSSWVTINGVLDIAADASIIAEGVEIVFGASSDAALNQVVEVGTNGACISAMINVTLIAGIDEFQIGWRQNEAFADAVGYTGYSDWAVLSIQDDAGDLDAEDEEAGAGTQTDDTGITWANGQRRALKVCISSAGAPSFYVSDASPDRDAPIYRQVVSANTGDALTAGDGMVPFIGYLAAGTTAAGITIEWVQLEYAR